MIKAAHLLMALALLAACNDQPEATSQNDQPAKDSTTGPTVNCYQYATQADTVTLKLTPAGENVMGMLTYSFKEKDRNIGSIKGTLRGDLLIADYSFMSEGIRSVRQVAFKKVGDTLIEGYGESVNLNDTMKFKDPESLNFGSSVKLQKIACE